MAEAAEFRFTGIGLLYGPESLRAQGGSRMEGRCVGADEGGLAGSCAKRRAAGRPRRVPLRERVGRGLRLKGTGSLSAGVERGVGKRGCSRGLDGGQSEGGVVCVVHLLLKPDMLKGRSLLVARLQASQVVGLIHWPWLGCLCAFISRFRLVLYPSRRW